MPPLSRSPVAAGWECRFPALAALGDPAWEAIRASAERVELPAGITVFNEGDPCTTYMLVLSGSVRVQKVTESGREITLYRVGDGESCVLTTSCLLGADRYPAQGVTESPVSAVVIPKAEFERGLAESPEFRSFVFNAYAQRLGALILLVEEVAFGRLDVRLAQRLLEHSGGGLEVTTTHQALAADLGTAREVISRQLKELERKGWIRLHRGRIELIDNGRIRQLAGM